MSLKNSYFSNLTFIFAWIIFGTKCFAAETVTAAKNEVLVSAAASLKDALVLLSAGFERDNPGVKILFNFGASGQLKAQVENGAPADAFISASSAEMDALELKGFIDKTTRRNIAKNSLVLVQYKKNQPKKSDVSSVLDLTKAGVTRISIGNPASVPAGRYAKESLEKLQIYDQLKPKLILAENVRQVLDYVARGEVDAGFVYKTDALSEDKVEVVEVIAETQHEPILYPAAVIRKSKNEKPAKDFLDFLSSKSSAREFQKLGFN